MSTQNGFCVDTCSEMCLYIEKQFNRHELINCCSGIGTMIMKTNDYACTIDCGKKT